MKFLGYPQLPSLAVDVGATTPVPASGTGSLAWSTTRNAVVVWNGSQWHGLMDRPTLENGLGFHILRDRGTYSSSAIYAYGDLAFYNNGTASGLWKYIGSGGTASPPVGGAIGTTWVSFFTVDASSGGSGGGEGGSG